MEAQHQLKNWFWDTFHSVLKTCSVFQIPEMLFSETDGEEKYEKKRKDEKKRNSGSILV